jgi:hypothetical protein
MKNPFKWLNFTFLEKGNPKIEKRKPVKNHQTCLQQVHCGNLRDQFFTIFLGNFLELESLLGSHPHMMSRF